LLFLILAAPIAAQYPADASALRWEGQTSSAGPFCWGFDCETETAAVVPGETGKLMVRGEWNQLYALAISLSSDRCLQLPNAAHGLVLSDPLFIFGAGVCADPSPILSCPNGTDTIAVAIPRALPAGFSFSVQAIVSVPSGPAEQRYSFTQGIRFVVN
jgi:hypothetical protein